MNKKGELFFYTTAFMGCLFGIAFMTAMLTYVLVGIAKADIISLLKEGMSADEVNEIMQINPDYEFIRGNFYNRERYFIWKGQKADFSITKGFFYKEKPKFNSLYLWITFLKNKDEWKVWKIKEIYELSFKPFFSINGRNFLISIAKGEVWTDFPDEYNLNWQGINLYTWYDKCGEPSCYNNCIKK